MKITSKKELVDIASEKNYRPEILEKIFLLLDLSSALMSVSFLNKNLVLKGGTAINLFCTENLPRLSVDLDFNYIGSAARETMLKDKQIINEIIEDICNRMNFLIKRNTNHHAGGKMVLSYSSLMGSKGELELDINYMYRVPLWNIENKTPIKWLDQVSVPVLNIHELAAGKIHALLDRDASRDLFDSHELLTKWNLSNEKLRLAFTVYTAMIYDNYKNISLDQVNFSTADIKNKLIPVLNKQEANIITTNTKNIRDWAENIVKDCKNELEKIIIFNDNEIEFLELLQNEGKNCPELLTTDKAFCDNIKKHPLLLWRIKNRESTS